MLVASAFIFSPSTFTFEILMVLDLSFIFPSVSPRLTAIIPPTKAFCLDFDVMVPLNMLSFTVTVHPPITSAARPPILCSSLSLSSESDELLPQVQFVTSSVVPWHRPTKPLCHILNFGAFVSSVTDIAVRTVTFSSMVVPLASPRTDDTNAGHLSSVVWLTFFDILQLIFPSIITSLTVTFSENGIIAKL